MTPKERAVKALRLEQPEEVPTWELVFAPVKEAFGQEFMTCPEWDLLAAADREKAASHNALLYLKIAERYGHSIIMTVHEKTHGHGVMTARKIKSLAGEKYLVVRHGDATFGIPCGESMEQFFYDLFDRKEEMLAHAYARVEAALEANKVFIDAGVDGFALCSDYCYNSGPFLSPPMFREFIAGPLEKLVSGYRRTGCWVIKHTDGNIMPVIDQIVECGPHALHSLDPMAGVDIAEVKKLYGKKVCLMGNVDCSKLQTGTEEEVIRNCEYAMESGKPGGGYFFCTSNCVFPGLPLERYELMMEFYEKNKAY